MSSRLDRSWTVLASHHAADVSRCVDVFCRPDGTFGFEEFRRDPEDMGRWTGVAYYSDQEFTSAAAAVNAATEAIPWLKDALP